MHRVQLELTDQIYALAKRRAVEAGFESVDEYLTGVVSDDLASDSDNLDHFFTPERIAHIDQAAAQVRAGEFYTAAEVREHFKKRFEQ